MEVRRLLDVPITEEERRSSNADSDRLLISENSDHGTRSNDYGPGLGRFESLRRPAHQLRDSDYVLKSSAVHESASANVDNPPSRFVDFNQPTGYNKHATYSRLDFIPDLWKPFWIHKATLGAFLLLFVVIFVGLVVLRRFSVSLNGYTYDSSITYYVWTYVPVAVLIVITILWGQVDHYFKLLGPWDELRKGPVPASRSLLLDYISPINIVSLYVAFKRGYIPVVLSIAVFFFLKIITVFSAALLVPLPTHLTTNTSSALSTRFFDASSFETRNGYARVSPFNSDPVYSVLGNLKYGLPYEAGVRREYAYLPVSMATDAESDLANATFSAMTDVLIPDLSCQSIDARVVGNRTIQANTTTANTTNNFYYLQLPIGTICSNWTRPWVYAMNPQRERTPPRQLEGTMRNVWCTGVDEEGSTAFEPAGILFTLTDMRYLQTIAPNNTILNSRRNVSAITSIFCTSNYYLSKANLTNSSAIFGESAIQIQTSQEQNKTLDGLTRRNLAVLYDGIMTNSDGLFGTRQDNTLALEIPTTVFNLMAMVINQTNIEPLLDPAVMQRAAESTFRRVMSRYAAQRLTQPTTSNVTAIVTYTTMKLHVSSVPWYAMLVASGITALCTLGLLIVSPPSLVPQDPSLLATHATILARSPELNQLLRQCTSDQSSLSAALDGHEYGSAIATNQLGESSFKIMFTEGPSRSVFPIRDTTRKLVSPYFILFIVIVISVLGSIALIVLLQFVQYRSDRDQGLLDIEFNSNTPLYFRSIPIFIMLLVAGMTYFFDSNVAIFSTWNRLACGKADARQSLLSHLIGKLPPLAFLEALQARHFNAVFSIIAVMLASILAVIASGLYSVEPVIAPGPAQSLTANDFFQMQNRYNVLDDQGAAGVLKLIGDSNISYPMGTYDDLVFPTWSSLQIANMSVATPVSVVGPSTAILPALRANLRCDAMTSQNLNLTYIPASPTYNRNRYRIDTFYNLPETCNLGGPNRNLSVSAFRTEFNTTNSTNVVYGGQMYDLLFGQNSSLVANFGETRAATTGNNPAIGCPSLAFTFAEIRTNNQQAQITTLVCYQQVQSLRANVTFKPNSTQIDPDHPPMVINSTIRVLDNSNSSINVQTFDWRIQRNIDRQLYGLKGDRLQPSTVGTLYYFDAFYSYLFDKVLKQEPSTMAGRANQPALADAINTLYRKYMAQVLNSNMRTPLATNSNSRKRQATTPSVEMSTNTIKHRLVQNRASKLILQILLGLSVLFLILAYTFTHFHHLLPCNPCSIAGTMSLLAGSDLCWSPGNGLCDCCRKPYQDSWNHEQSDSDLNIAADPTEFHVDSQPSPRYARRVPFIPTGTEWMDRKSFAAVFSRRRYSLGWWKEDIGKQRQRRFGIDVGDRPDGEHDDDWELGRRRSIGEGRVESFVMRGGGMLGDQRGVYQRAGSDAVPSSMLAQMSGALASPQPGISSPRRVRFEDDT